MKWLIRGVGILTALFAVFFFLLVADKLYYQNSMDTYEISLDRSLSGREIQDVAESAGVTFRITYYNDTNFGHHDLKMVFINPGDIKEGKQASIFPSSKITYETFDADSNLNLQYFTLLSEDEADANHVAQLFAKEDVQANIEKVSPISFRAGMLFSTLNLSFFLLLAVLLFLSIAAYYVHRLKEIGVLKLNGWTEWSITVHLIAPLLVQIYISMLTVMLPVVGYILYKDAAMIRVFLSLSLWMYLFLTLVFLIASLGGVLFVRRVDRVGAIKNSRNNEMLLRILLLFKAAVTIMLILSMDITLTNVNALQTTNAAIEELKQYDFYKLTTPVVPEDSVLERFNHIIEGCEDTDVFNYAVVSGTYSAEKIKSAKTRTVDELIENNHVGLTLISANLLPVIQLLNAERQVMTPEDIPAGEIIWLIPTHFQDSLSEILSFLGASPNDRIVYIQDGQVKDILTQPGFYTFDSIYKVQPLKKALYLNQSDILLTKTCAERLQQKFLSADVDEASVQIESQNTEYRIFQGNISLNICESLFRVVINFASFVLCATAATIIFLELRKKEIGVYHLLGRYPRKAIWVFVSINLLSTISTAVIVRPSFLLLALLECALYSVLIGSYLRQKAVLALKGA